MLKKLLVASALVSSLFAANAEAQYAGVVPGASDFVYDKASGSWYSMLGAVGAPGVIADNFEGTKATYSASFQAVTVAAAATDIFVIQGSATKTLRVNHVEVSCTASTAANYNASLVVRSAANTGGTSTGVNKVPHDSTDVAATSNSVAYYTANPSGLGTLVGIVRTAQLYAANAGTMVNTLWDFGIRNDKNIVLRGIAQNLAINLNGVTLTGGVCSGGVEWTEE